MAFAKAGGGDPRLCLILGSLPCLSPTPGLSPPFCDNCPDHCSATWADGGFAKALDDHSFEGSGPRGEYCIWDIAPESRFWSISAGLSVPPFPKRACLGGRSPAPLTCTFHNAPSCHPHASQHSGHRQSRDGKRTGDSLMWVRSPALWGSRESISTALQTQPVQLHSQPILIQILHGSR